MNSKSTTTPFFAAAFALWLMIQSLLAGTFGNFTYEDHGSWITITGYPKNAKGAVVIPAIIYNKPVRAVGGNAFSNCTGLTSVNISPSVTSIELSAFAGCTGLTSVTIPSSVTTIGDFSFYGCSGLTSVTIPNSVTSIGTAAFSICISLTSVTIPSGVTRIGDYPFHHCTKLVTISVNAANPNYSSRNGVLFNKLQTSLIQCPAGARGNYIIPSSVTSIGDCAFWSCTGLTGITIPSSVTTIGDSSFWSCTGLTSITIDSSVTSIGRLTFYNCSSLSSVAIASGITSIGESAFRHCSSLPDVTIPPSVTSIGDGAFAECTDLLAISVSTANHKYSSMNGVLFNKLKTSLIQYPSGAGGNYTIPSSVTSIEGSTSGYCADRGGGAFSYCYNLSSITIPSSVSSIGGYAFYNSSGLNSVTFRGNAPSMGTSVFDGTATDFKVSYYKSRTGFTSPSWYGYQSVALVGAPEITVKCPVGKSLVDGIAKKSFGAVKIGKSSRPKTFIIKNTGTANLKNLAITKTGSKRRHFIVSGLTKTTLAPGKSTTFKVKFKSAAIGTRRAAIHIKSNDANENPFDIRLSGSGTR